MQQKIKTISEVVTTLPKPHRYLLVCLLCLTTILVAWRPEFAKQLASWQQQDDQQDTQAKLPVSSDDFDDGTADIPPENTGDELDKIDAQAHQYVVTDGDTLNTILTQYGVSYADIDQLTTQYPDLHQLAIGQSLTWQLNAQGELENLSWHLSPKETRVYQRQGQQFVQTIQMKQGQWQQQTINGKITGSFANSALSSGLSYSQIQQMTKALEWQVDFRQLHQGDGFSAVFNTESLAGKTQQSQLLAVKLHTGSGDYYAFRAEDGKYYDKHGQGLTQGFLRYPTARRFRVSSNFNLHRLNPVTHRVAPHRGVDFAMPVGTPILAVADGEVLVAKRSGAAGNYIAIRHGRQYMTRYMHLKQLLVQPGQQIKRGQRIALSGNTGRTTGPHLHYEIWINQQAVNPLTAKLPRLDNLTGRDLNRYLVQVKALLAQLPA